MNKKFLSAILFGALMVTSTGTFVSCKDYDDEINDLQEQIDNLASKSDVEAKLSQLLVAIDAAKAEAIAAAKTADAEALGNLADEVDAMLAKVQATVEEDMAKYKAEIADVMAKAEAMVGKVADFVTSVELVYSNSAQTPKRYISIETYHAMLKDEDFKSAWDDNRIELEEVFVEDEDGNKELVGYNYYYLYVNNSGVNNAYDGQYLNTTTITEYDNVFGPNETSVIKFTKGNQHQRGDKFIVRVSPTNAVLTPEMLSLVNSQGQTLDILKIKDVKPFTDLLTRSTTANGLWEVEVELTKYDKDTYAAAKYTEEGATILYAVQVNNTLSTAATRNVVSTYDLSLGNHYGFGGLGTLNYFVDDTHVNNIATRVYGWNSKSLENEWGYKDVLYKELNWSYRIPAVAAITEGANKNVDIVYVDANWSDVVRYNEPCYPAVQGVPMKIQLTASYSTSKVYDASSYVRGLYVTLDKANAVESAPSELNAWNSYEYKGLNEVVEGTSIEITVNSKNGEAINDVIGFRVYAVNHDGTLVDPDGKAFYVRLGEKAAETQTIAASIAPKTTADVTTYVKLTDAQKAIVSKYYGVTPVVEVSKDNQLITSGEHKQTTSPVYTVEFVKDDKGTPATKKEEMNYAKFTLPSVAEFIDGATYKQTYVYKNATNHVLGEVNFELVKTPFNTFPTDFAFRPKQETTDGSGKFIAYMIPETGNYVVPAEYATKGIKNLNNVFYGLDENYTFTFATSVDADVNKDGAYDSKTVVYSGNASEVIYNLEVPVKFIDNTNWHSVAVTYWYQNVSTHYDTVNKVWCVGVDHPVKYAEAIEAMYACWEDASNFAWGTYTKEGATLSYKPELQWTSEGVTREVKLNTIFSTNSYDNDYFGLDLESLVNTKRWLKFESIKLTVGDQENPYYVPSLDGSVIKFTQKNTQVDAAPTANHEEKLTIIFRDAFKCPVKIELDVTVKAPEKK